MGDLFVYMPPQPQEAELTNATVSMLRAYISLKFGLILVLGRDETPYGFSPFRYLRQIRFV